MLISRVISFSMFSSGLSFATVLTTFAISSNFISSLLFSPRQKKSIVWTDNSNYVQSYHLKCKSYARWLMKCFVLYVKRFTVCYHPNFFWMLPQYFRFKVTSVRKAGALNTWLCTDVKEIAAGLKIADFWGLSPIVVNWHLSNGISIKFVNRK